MPDYTVLYSRRLQKFIFRNKLVCVISLCFDCGVTSQHDTSVTPLHATHSLSDSFVWILAHFILFPFCVTHFSSPGQIERLLFQIERRREVFGHQLLRHAHPDRKRQTRQEWQDGAPGRPVSQLQKRLLLKTRPRFHALHGVAQDLQDRTAKWPISVEAFSQQVSWSKLRQKRWEVWQC